MLGPFKEECYLKVDIDSLVMVALYSVVESGESCSFERLVAECFNLFPKRFSLKAYPQWPDSERVDKSWLRCRTDKAWITGTVKTGFHITAAGESAVAKAIKKLESVQSQLLPSAHLKTRTREEALLNHVRSHYVFQRYQQNPQEFSLSEQELRAILLTTTSASKNLVIASFENLLSDAIFLGFEDVIAFLKACRVQYEPLLKKRSG